MSEFPPGDKGKKDRQIRAARAFKTGRRAASTENAADAKIVPELPISNSVETSPKTITTSMEVTGVPPELREIYGESIPAETLEMYGKLKGAKRASYLEKITADQAKRRPFAVKGAKKAIRKNRGRNEIAEAPEAFTSQVPESLGSEESIPPTNSTNTIPPIRFEDNQARDHSTDAPEDQVTMHGAGINAGREAEKAKIDPNERQQAKLLKALLAGESNWNKVIAGDESDLSPLDRARAIELLKSSDTRAEAARIIKSSILSIGKQLQYAAQLELLRAEAERVSVTTPEVEFDPHSVPSAQTIREQRQAQEVRVHFAKDGLLPKDAVHTPDVNIGTFVAPQYDSRKVISNEKLARGQAELEALNQGVGKPLPAAPAPEPGQPERGAVLRTALEEAETKRDAAFEAKTRPNDEWTELVEMYPGQEFIPDDILSAYTSLDAALKESIASGDESAQRESIEKLDTFMAAQRVSAETREPEAIQNEKKEQDEIDTRIAAERTERAEQIRQQIRQQIEELNRVLARDPNNMDAFADRSNRELELEDLMGIDHSRTEGNISPQSEATPKEWRERLSSLILGATEKTSERFAKSKEYLSARAREMDAKAVEMGGIEKTFRGLGEKYNKLNWKYKLGVGAALGVGAIVTSGVSIAAPLAFMSLIAGQRIAGMAGVFLKAEKKLQEKSEGILSKTDASRAAMFGAALLSLGAGYAIKEAVDWASDTKAAQAVQKWLGGMLENKVSVPGIQEPVSKAEVPPAVKENLLAEKQQLEAALAQKEAALTAEKARLAELRAAAEAKAQLPSVEATKGKGYEFMAKKLWEQLQDKNLNANDYDAETDMYKLLKADAKTIDKVVHEIAAEGSGKPNSAFFKSDGRSVVINLGDKMTVNEDGNLAVNEKVAAPANAPVTPAYDPAGAKASVMPRAAVPAAQSFIPGPIPAEASGFPRETIDSKRGISAPITTEEPVAAPAESQPEPIEPPLSPLPPASPETPSYTIEPPMAPETPPETPPAPPVISPSELPRVEMNTQPVETYYDSTFDKPTAPVEAVSPAAQEFMDKFGVPMTEPHFYQGAGKELFVFGGSPDEQAKAITDFLSDPANKNAIIRGASTDGKYQLLFSKDANGEFIAAPAESPGFLGLFRSFLKPPTPDQLQKLIK